MGETHHSIIEIALVVLELKQGRLELVDHFESLIRPDVNVPTKILELTGINTHDLQTAPRFVDLAQTIELYTRETTLVAQGARQDFELLKAHFDRIGVDYRRNFICTLNLARENDPELPSYDLKSLCRLYDIKLKHHHRALPDAMACAELFARIYTPRTYQHDEELGLLFKFTEAYPMIATSELKAFNLGAGLLFLYLDNKIVSIFPYEHGVVDVLKLLLKLAPHSFDRLSTQSYEHYLLALIDSQKLKKRFRPKLEVTPKISPEQGHLSYPQEHFQLDLVTKSGAEVALIFRDGRIQGILRADKMQFIKETAGLKRALLLYLRNAKNAKVRPYSLKTLKSREQSAGR